MAHTLAFPDGFAWGVATASYQIEGAHDVDGRSPSIWDTWSRTPGATTTGETGDVACDHYHRYEADLDLMAALGVRHYRLSIAWPRIIPGGTGAVNERGIAFYDRLIDACLRRGITPYVTCYHWDLPQALQDRYQGWRSRQCAHDFADYAAVLARRFGDRVRHWMTMNEIPCFTTLGHTAGAREAGMHAPGVAVPTRKDRWQTTVNAIVAHGLGAQALRAHAPRPIRVGIADNPGVSVPLRETPEDIAAAALSAQDIWANGMVLWPILTGRYSAETVRIKGAAGELPEITEADLRTAHQPLDFIGLNIYSAGWVRAGGPGGGKLAFPAAYPRLDMPWLQIMPDALYWGVRMVRDLGFAGDIYISENGCAAQDAFDQHGEIIDLDRILYLKSYLRGLHRACAEGLGVAGYFQWSFMDNFEWAWGYAKRFGLVYVNYQTQQRTPKLSAQWYAEVIKANALV